MKIDKRNEIVVTDIQNSLVRWFWLKWKALTCFLRGDRAISIHLKRIGYVRLDQLPTLQKTFGKPEFVKNLQGFRWYGVIEDQVFMVVIPNCSSLQKAIEQAEETRIQPHIILLGQDGSSIYKFAKRFACYGLNWMPIKPVFRTKSQKRKDK